MLRISFPPRSVVVGNDRWYICYYCAVLGLGFGCSRSFASILFVGPLSWFFFGGAVLAVFSVVAIDWVNLLFRDGVILSTARWLLPLVEEKHVLRFIESCRAGVSPGLLISLLPSSVAPAGFSLVRSLRTEGIQAN